MKKGVPNFKGENLTEAREARFLSVEALSELIGVSRQMIYCYEKNSKSPSFEILQRMASSLKLPIGFFTADFHKFNSDLEGSPLFYRSLKPTVKEARKSGKIKYAWTVRLCEYISNFVDFPPVNFPVFDVPSKPENLSFDEIEELALKTRAFWGLGQGPIPNMVRLLESKGAVVAKCNFHANELDAFSQWYNERPYILLGKDKNCAVRSRFDAAHELGHLVMHRHIAKKYASKQNEFFNLIEDQAQRFAGAFLFPSKPFSVETVGLNLELLATLKSRWKMSIGAQIIRAEDLNFITPDESTRLWRTYTTRGWKKREPLDLEIPVEELGTLKNSIELIVNHGVQDKHDIMSFMNLEHDLEEIADLNPRYMHDEGSNLIQLKPSVVSAPEKPANTASGEVLFFPKRM